MSRASDEELERALTAMQAPCPLLKFGSQGRPKFRKFWLSADLRILHWVSPNKRTGQCKSTSTHCTRAPFTSIDAKLAISTY